MQIAPGIYSIGQEEGGHVHAFLLDDGKDLTLIDTGYDDDGRHIRDEMTALKRPLSDIRHIVLTHAHKSHLGGVATLRGLTGAAVYCHEWEEGIVTGKRKATPVSKVPQRPLKVYKLQLGLALGLGKHTPCRVDYVLQEGAKIGPLEVIATPGHTPGCLSLWWPEKRALFAGDIVATWPEVDLAWPGLTLDNAQNKRSVAKLTDLSNAEILCVGHGEPIVEGAAELIKKLVK